MNGYAGWSSASASRRSMVRPYRCRTAITRAANPAAVLRRQPLARVAVDLLVAVWYAKPNRLWRPRRWAISRRSASRKVASRIRRGREMSGSETGTVLSGTNARSDRTVQAHPRGPPPGPGPRAGSSGRPKGSMGVSRLDGKEDEISALPRAGHLQDGHRQDHRRLPDSTRGPPADASALPPKADAVPARTSPRPAPDGSLVGPVVFPGTWRRGRCRCGRYACLPLRPRSWPARSDCVTRFRPEPVLAASRAAGRLPPPRASARRPPSQPPEAGSPCSASSASAPCS